MLKFREKRRDIKSDDIMGIPTMTSTSKHLIFQIEVSKAQLAGHMWPRMAVNAPQHKIVNSLKTFFFAHQFSSALVCSCVAQDTSSSSVAQRCRKAAQPGYNILSCG